VKISATPKGCWVRRANIESSGVEIGYDCHGEGSGGSGRFPLTRGRAGFGNYRSKFFRGVRNISFRGMTVSGVGSDVGFVLMPAHATCSREGNTLSCRLQGDTSSPSLSGPRRKRKRR
jgi:hypothetical protein